LSEDRTRRRVGVISLGCAKNLVDTEVMLGHLQEDGFELVTDPADADTIVVNTCGFIHDAREESLQTILEAAELKKTGKLQRLLVAGCMVQRYPDQLKENLPEVDGYIDLDGLHTVTALAGGESSPTSDLPMAGSSQPVAATYLYTDATPRLPATPGRSAYIKIAEGCDHSCSFCAIPGFRGGFRSRDPQSVVREARRLAAGGVREVNLIAQDSSHYGKDIGLDDGLAQLLIALDEVQALRWIRLHYLYPNTITQNLIETMAALPRVVNYVDLPLQHSHPAMLKRMRRGGSGEGHLKLLQRFRDAMDDPMLRTTLIVGFPGETDEEFEHLLEFVRAARFDHLGVFTYSHEENTPAISMTDDVPQEIKEQRHDRLMACQQEIRFREHDSRLGQTWTVLVEGAHPETEHLLVGRGPGQAPDVDGQVLINDGVAAPGDFVRVELTERAGYDMVGRVLGPA